MAPFEELRPHLLAALELGHVVVEAPTGTGKSTLLPTWARSIGPVAVIEPRRLACRALARRVAELDGDEVGGRVGYAVRFEQCFTPATEVLFLTPGVALRWLAEGRMARFAVVMLDEFHERRWDTDLLAALLRHPGEQRGEQTRKPRLLFTSATVEGERLTRWLGGERLSASAVAHPVEVRYTEELALPTLRELEGRVGAAVSAGLREWPTGDILVFLPGRGEIETVRQALTGGVDAEFIPLHAGTDPKLQDRALAPATHRRVILATNVAETSLTIPGVTVVIDSGLERRSHHRNGRTVLALHPVSQAAADQRKGRAGRVAPGLCIRLWGRQARLEPFTPPEVQREELTDLLLAAAAAGIPAARLDFPDPLPPHALERATARLAAMGAIDAAGAITAHGRRLFPLPLDPLFAHLVSVMPDAASRAAMVDLAAALTVNRRLLPLPHDVEGVRALKGWMAEACDATTLIRLVRADPPAPLACDRAGVAEARQIARQVRTALGLPPLGDEPIPRTALLEAVAIAAPELLFVRRAKRREALGNGESEVEVGRESRFSEEAEAALVLDQHSIPARGTLKTLNIATCMAPIELATLARLGVGEVSDGPPRWEEGRLLVERQRLYAGRVIASERVEPEGAAACAAFALAILERRLLKPAGERAREDIEAWNLWLALGMGEGESVEPLPWLASRLAALGVEVNDDLALIEPDDLRFPGIPEWERRGFDEKYPRHLKLENLRVAVSYDGRRREVILERLGGVRRSDPKRLELPAWPGWRILYRNASREVEIR